MSEVKQDRLVRLPAVLEATGLSKTTVYGLMKCDRFPLCVRVGMRAVAWRRSDLDAWMASRQKAGARQEASV